MYALLAPIAASNIESEASPRWKPIFVIMPTIVTFGTRGCHNLNHGGHIRWRSLIILCEFLLISFVSQDQQYNPRTLDVEQVTPHQLYHVNKRRARLWHPGGKPDYSVWLGQCHNSLHPRVARPSATKVSTHWGHRFAGDIFKCNIVNENLSILTYTC